MVQTQSFGPPFNPLLLGGPANSVSPSFAPDSADLCFSRRKLRLRLRSKGREAGEGPGPRPGRVRQGPFPRQARDGEGPPLVANRSPVGK